MCGQAHQIDGQGAEVNVKFASGLRGVNVEDDALLAANSANGRYVLNDANFVVDEHDADQNGVGTQSCLKHFEVKQAVILHVKVSDFKALTLKLAHGVEHGFVLCFNRNEVLAAAFVKLGSALEGQVVRLGSATGPNYFAGVGTDEFSHIDAGFFNRFFGLPTPSVAA